VAKLRQLRHGIRVLLRLAEFIIIATPFLLTYSLVRHHARRQQGWFAILKSLFFSRAIFSFR
jgi:hypothetical protein